MLARPAAIGQKRTYTLTKKIRLVMDLSGLLNVHAWTPIAEVCSAPELVTNGIFKVAPDIYLRTQLHDGSYQFDDPRAPFVTKAYWSPSIDGLMCLVAGTPLKHLGEPIVIPPFELASGSDGYYSELAAKAVNEGGQLTERAVYSNKGEFLYRGVRIGRLEYCFASHEDKDEPTFAIDIKLIRKPKLYKQT